MGSTLVINGYNTNSKTCSYVICDMINFIQKKYSKWNCCKRRKEWMVTKQKIYYYNINGN